MAAQGVLFDGLLEDAVLAASDPAASRDAVDGHVGYRTAWFGEVVGRLVVPDRRLAEVGRHVPDGVQVRTTVVNTGGAGGLVALTARTVPGVSIHAVESPLRDLADLAGNARRVVAAAAGLAGDVEVYVGLPYAPGWQAAAELVEAAGLFGKIRTTDEAGADDGPARLAEQLSLLVETDLPFTIAGLDRTRPKPAGASWDSARQWSGLLPVLAAIDALIDSAEQREAVDILRGPDADEIAATIAGWDDGRQRRVRHRVKAVDTTSIPDAIDDLVALGVLRPS